MRPALSMTVASIRPARRAPSAVADIASSRRSGRSMALQVEAKRQREIGFQRAFVDFVEDDRGDAVQAGIGLQAADQQALGDDLDAGGGGDGGVEPGAVADGAADRLAAAATPCGWRRRGWRGGAAPASGSAVAAPGRVQQGERHQRGFAGAGRGDEHGVAAGGEAGGSAGKASVTGRSGSGCMGGRVAPIGGDPHSPPSQPRRSPAGRRRRAWATTAVRPAWLALPGSLAAIAWRPANCLAARSSSRRRRDKPAPAATRSNAGPKTMPRNPLPSLGRRPVRRARPFGPAGSSRSARRQQPAPRPT